MDRRGSRGMLSVIVSAPGGLSTDGRVGGRCFLETGGPLRAEGGDGVILFERESAQKGLAKDLLR